MSGHYISSADWPDFAALLRAWRSGELRRPRGPAGGAGAGPSPHRIVCLYGELPNGGTVPAEVLRPERELQVQDVAVMGWPIALDKRTFTLSWQGEDLPAIPLEATAAEVFKRLSGSPLGELLVDVTLGSRTDVKDVHPGRWRLHLTPPEDGADHPLLQVTTDPISGGDNQTLGPAARVVVSRSRWVGSGGELIDVHSVLPTGEPTPLRRGAQCAVALFAGLGWGVIAAEMRKYPDGSFGGPGYDGEGGEDEGGGDGEEPAP